MHEKMDRSRYENMQLALFKLMDAMVSFMPLAASFHGCNHSIPTPKSLANSVADSQFSDFLINMSFCFTVSTIFL
jgi:hypothetical protein